MSKGTLALERYIAYGGVMICRKLSHFQFHFMLESGLIQSLLNATYFASNCSFYFSGTAAINTALVTPKFNDSAILSFHNMKE